MTADASIYVSPTGNDTTGTGTLTNPFKTLGKAAEEGKRYHGHFAVDILLMDGVHTISEAQSFTLANNSLIRLSSASKAASKATLQSGDGRCIGCYGTHLAIIEHLTIVATGAGDGGGVIHFNRSSGIVQNCIIKHNGTTGNRHGVVVIGGKLEAANNQIDGCMAAMLAAGGGFLSCSDNTGSSNSISLSSDRSIIISRGTTPTATTAQSKSNNGQIFA